MIVFNRVSEWPGIEIVGVEEEEVGNFVQKGIMTGSMSLSSSDKEKSALGRRRRLKMASSLENGVAGFSTCFFFAIRFFKKSDSDIYFSDFKFIEKQKIKLSYKSSFF